jgi:hypothetical protein
MVTALIDLMGTYYYAGNLGQMEAMARSILAAIPEDIVALQFLGLALYRMGRMEAARQVFIRVAARLGRAKRAKFVTTGELASAKVYREATSPASGLGEAWQHIAQALHSFGFNRAAARAQHASLTAHGLWPAT